MSLRELGDRAGYAKSTLCEIEKGRFAPSAARMPSLASALGVGIEKLFEGVR
jgi:transcriptional regulator with XRE-family HTH domain